MFEDLFRRFEAARGPKKVETIICIPGTWNSLDELKEVIMIAAGGEHIIAGTQLLNKKANRLYTVEFCDFDEKMQLSFSVAGKVTGMSERSIARIGEHTSVVYLIGETGNPEALEYLSHSANAILKAGGLGIKIETAGKAFEKNRWAGYMENLSLPDLYELYVLDSITDEDKAVYSCGMQNLGYKDTIVSGVEFQDAVTLIRSFSYYQILENPVIEHEQTFRMDLDSPIVQITDEPDQPYIGHDTFENIFGMWRLTKV